MKIKPIAPGARGFSLVELMVVVCVFAGLAGAAYAMYSVQQRSYFLQEQLVEMQQNIRALEFFLEKDVRMAGYDVFKEGNARFLIAKPGEIAFSADLGRPRSPAVNCAGAGCDTMPDGNIISAPCTDCVAETIRYALKNDTNLDGIPNDVRKPTALTKLFNGTAPSGSNTAQDVVEGIQAIEFLYNMRDGTAHTDPVAAGQSLADIRSVTVSLLMRTRSQIKGFKDTTKWVSAGGTKWGPGGDAFLDAYKRKLVITNIQCRNLSLQDQG
jgi:prepilin-type N-terminal cleavage/methylation domain-containing protein